MAQQHSGLPSAAAALPAPLGAMGLPAQPFMPPAQLNAALAAAIAANNTAINLSLALAASASGKKLPGAALSAALPAAGAASAAIASGDGSEQLNRGKWTAEEDEELRQAVGGCTRWWGHCALFHTPCCARPHACARKFVQRSTELGIGR